MVHCSLESVSLNSFWRKSLSKKPFFKSVFPSVKVTSSSTPPGSNEGIASGGYVSLFFFMLNELHVLFIGLFVSIALWRDQASCLVECSTVWIFLMVSFTLFLRPGISWQLEAWQDSAYTFLARILHWWPWVLHHCILPGVTQYQGVLLWLTLNVLRCQLLELSTEMLFSPCCN